MTALLNTGTHLHAPEFSPAELATLNREFEHAPAQAVIEWAVEQFHPFMCLSASMTDAVLIDLAVRVVSRFADERQAGEPFAAWLERAGGTKVIAADLKDLDDWPTPEERPDYYIDFGETGPYVADVGEGECAAG